MYKMKFIAKSLVMSFILHLVCSECTSNEYLTQDNICCRNPPPDYYIKKNCTTNQSTSTRLCSTCAGEGMKILTNCTRFSDTKCTRVEISTLKPGTTTKVPPNPSFNILIPITVVVLFTVLILFVVFCYCLHKCRKTDKFRKVVYHL